MRSGVVRATTALATLVFLVVPVVGRTNVRAATAPVLDVEVYPVSVGDPSVTPPTIFVADGGLWSESDQGAIVQRVDPDAGSLVGRLSTPTGTPASRQLADGMFWSVVVDPNGAPCDPERPGEDRSLPYVLRGLDVATGLSAALVPLGWCQLRPSRTVSPVQLVAAAGGSVWVSHAVANPEAAPTTETVRVDVAAGAIAAVAAHDAPSVVAVDDQGMWGAGPGLSPPYTGTPFGGRFFSLPLARVDGDGAIVLPDALRGGYWDPYSLVPDASGAWFLGARRAPRFGGLLDPALVRIARDGRVTMVPKVRPWSVATDDDGHTWFLGTSHRAAKTTQPEPVDWALGRVDTRTGKHLRTYSLDLPDDFATVTTSGASLRLFGATGGSIWIHATTTTGSSLVRVTEPRD